MSEAKNASLTVLGGPLAGVRADLPEDGVVTLGSAPDCTVPLNAPSVSPVHARIVLEGGQATVHPTGTERPVHINDTPLGSGSATLRNGDILWLGVPGEDDVVMLQCVLPVLAPPPPPPAVTRGVPTPEIETTALWTTPPPPDGAPEAPQGSPEAGRTGDEPTIALTPEQIQASRDIPATPAPPPPPPPPPPQPAEDEPLVIALDEPQEDEAVVVGEPDLVSADDIAPVSFGDAADEAVIVDEDELFSAAAPTFAGPRPEIEEGAPETDAEATVAEPVPDVVVPDSPAPEPPAAPEPPPPPAAPDLPAGEIVEDAVPVVEPLDASPPPDSAEPLPEGSAPTVAGPPPASPDASSPSPPSGPQASSPLSGLVGSQPSAPPSAGAPAAPPPADQSTPAARPAARPSAPDASARTARRPDRSSHPAASQRRRPARARPAPPPEEAFDDELDDDEAPGRGPVLLAIGGFAGVLLVVALGWAVWRFVLAKPASAPAPAPVAAATAAPAPVAVAPPVAEPTPEAAPPTETAPAAPAPRPTPTPPPSQAAEPAQPTPTPPPAAAPTPTPTPTPAPPPAAPAPAQPSAAELQAQQDAQRLETLLGQADTALASGQHDTAITRYTEALNLDPQSTRARNGRAQAIALRDQANRRFVPTRTRVQTEKEQGGGIAGFDMGDAELRKTPDFQGRIEFEMNPASGLQGGAPWTLRIFVVNEGDKPIQIQGIDAVTQVDGSGGTSAVSPRTREVPTQQRLLVGELTGTWSEGTNAWSTQVTVTANKGDSLRATLTWR